MLEQTPVFADTPDEPTRLQSGVDQGDIIHTFTFYAADNLFAVDVLNVLSVKADLEQIRALPVNSEVVRGVYKYLEVVVPIYDFAGLISRPSGKLVMQELIKNLEAREKDHIDWLNDLEVSIKDNVPFTKALDPHKCAFGKWYDNFSTRDETLTEILKRFDAPHKHIHSLAEKLLTLRDDGQQEAALEELRYERHSTLKRLKSLFHQAREQIRGMIRPVILFITKDGIQPEFGLIVDEINDVIDYPADGKQSDLMLSGLDDQSSLLTGIYVKEGGPDSLICNIDAITSS